MHPKRAHRMYIFGFSFFFRSLLLPNIIKSFRFSSLKPVTAVVHQIWNMFLIFEMKLWWEMQLRMQSRINFCVLTSDWMYESVRFAPLNLWTFFWQQMRKKWTLLADRHATPLNTPKVFLCSKSNKPKANLPFLWLKIIHKHYIYDDYLKYVVRMPLSCRLRRMWISSKCCTRSRVRSSFSRPFSACVSTVCFSSNRNKYCEMVGIVCLCVFAFFGSLSLT